MCKMLSKTSGSSSDFAKNGTKVCIKKEEGKKPSLQSLLNHSISFKKIYCRAFNQCLAMRANKRDFDTTSWITPIALMSLAEQPSWHWLNALGNDLEPFFNFHEHYIERLNDAFSTQTACFLMGVVNAFSLMWHSSIHC